MVHMLMQLLLHNYDGGSSPPYDTFIGASSWEFATAAVASGGGSGAVGGGTYCSMVLVEWDDAEGGTCCKVFVDGYIGVDGEKTYCNVSVDGQNGTDCCSHF